MVCIVGVAGRLDGVTMCAVSAACVVPVAVAACVLFDEQSDRKRVSLVVVGSWPAVVFMLLLSVSLVQSPLWT